MRIINRIVRTVIEIVTINSLIPLIVLYPLEYATPNINIFFDKLSKY